MKSFSWMSWMCLGAIVGGGCAAETDANHGRGSEDGTYRYVLGFDESSGITHFGGGHEVVVLTERGKEEAIDLPNTPSRLHPELSKTEHMTFDAGLTGGQTDWPVFASNWWPQSQNGVANRWDTSNKDLNDYSDRDNLSPIEKYDLMFYPGQSVVVPEVEHHNYADINKPESERGPKHKHEKVTVAGPATAWELRHHGVYQDWVHPESWWGHCNGWASYATTEELGFPKRDVRVKLVDGKLTECLGADTDGCILFKMGDIEALFSEVYFSDKATFAGRRCNTDPDKIERDEFGRPTDVACRDLNPGSFHVAVTGLLGRGAKHLSTNQAGKPAFIIDANYDWEVWNFPVSKFEIAEQEEVTREQAAQLVGSQSDYIWNAQAAKFVRVKLYFWMISDAVPWAQMKLRADLRSVAQQKETMHYVLELDTNGKILGGEWIKDPSFTWGPDSKKMHPDFMWAAVNSIGYGESADDTGGNDDNPYVSIVQLRAIAQCANDPTTCAPAGEEPTPEPEPSDSSCLDKCGGNAGACWCDAQCAQYGDCCSDYQSICVSEPEPQPTANSCVGHCGQNGAAPGSTPACYCDSVCSQYGDCCSDYAAVCN